MDESKRSRLSRRERTCGIGPHASELAEGHILARHVAVNGSLRNGPAKFDDDIADELRKTGSSTTAL